MKVVGMLQNVQRFFIVIRHIQYQSMKVRWYDFTGSPYLPMITGIYGIALSTIPWKCTLQYC